MRFGSMMAGTETPPRLGGRECIGNVRQQQAAQQLRQLLFVGVAVRNERFGAKIRGEGNDDDCDEAETGID